MSALEILLLLLLALLGGGYLVGTALNHRRAEAAILGLQQTLSAYGSFSKLKPSGPRSIAFRLLPRSGSIQFLDFTITLLAREWLPLWLWQRIRGVCDQLSIQANCQPVPNFDIRVFPLADLKDLQDLQQSKKPFKLLQEVADFGIYVRGVGSPSSRDALPAFITNFSTALLFLAIQSPPYNLALRLRLGQMSPPSYPILYQALHEIII